MRVVVYTHDYEPLGIVDLNSEQLERLRRFNGNHVRIHMAPPLDYRTHNVASLTVNIHEVMPLVEGMRWADGSARPIIVLRGLRYEHVATGQRVDALCDQVVRTALSMAAEREPRLRVTPEIERALNEMDARLMRPRSILDIPNRTVTTGDQRSVTYEDILRTMETLNSVPPPPPIRRPSLLNPAAAWPFPPEARPHQARPQEQTQQASDAPPHD